MKILPLHPQPLSGEILSSWMVRLAFANLYQIHTFYTHLVNYKAPIWNRDVDLHPPEQLINLLGNYTRQSERRLNELCLNSYEGLVFDDLQKAGSAPWMLRVGVYHRQRIRAGMQFCSSCLQEDQVPYFRKKWRLSFYVICEKHLTILLNQCPKCSSNLAYHRHGMGIHQKIPVHGIHFCHHCFFDFRESEIVEIPSYFDGRLLTLYRNLLDQFDYRMLITRGVTPNSSLAFFKGLRVLISVLIGRRGNELRRVIKKLLGIELDLKKQNEHSHIEFETLSVMERLKIILIVMWMIDDWPNNFIYVCRLARVTRSNFSTDRDVLPFWLSIITYEYLDTQTYLPSTEEIIASGIYLSKLGGPVNPDNLKQVLAISSTYARVAWRVWSTYRKKMTDY